jgi:hypothetical protein
MELLRLALDQELDVLRGHVQGVCEELIPHLFLLVVRGLRLEVIQKNVILLLASRELVIGHFKVENDVLPIEHGHEYFYEEFPLNLTHLKGLCNENHVLHDIEVNLIGELFALVDVVKKHDENIGLSAVQELDFDLSLPLFGVRGVLLLLENPSEVARVADQIFLGAEEFHFLDLETGILRIVLPRVVFMDTLD